MRVLRLGSSLDTEGAIPPGQRVADISIATLAAHCDEPVDLTNRRAWPTNDLPAALDRWLDEYRPDVVSIAISAFWVETDTLAKRVERFGGLGRSAARAGKGASLRPRIAKARAYHALRRLALATIGGAPPFEPDDVAEVLGQCIRLVVSREDVALAVVASPFSPDTAALPSSRKRARQRRTRLFVPLRSLCSALHVAHHLPDHADFAFDPSYREPDRIHWNARAHALMGAIEGRALISAFEGSVRPVVPARAN